jgi:ribosome biogenesis ATPase
MRVRHPHVSFSSTSNALIPRHDDMLSESSARVINTLLTELDRLDSRRGIFVLMATNWPDMLNLAMCQPGWLDKLLYVDLPVVDECTEIVHMW